MTTTQALPMLDQVMLWVARGFSFAAPAFVAYGIWSQYTDTDRQLFYKYEHQPVFSISDLLFFTVCAIWCGLWLISTWHRPTTITRIVLGLTASYVFLFVLMRMVAMWPYHLFAEADLPATAVAIFILLGSLSMVLTAIRIDKLNPVVS